MLNSSPLITQSIYFNILLTVLILILAPLIYFLIKNQYIRAKINSINYDSIKLKYVQELLPYIANQIERSCQAIYLQYQSNVQLDKLKRNLNISQYNQFIQDIRTHFYGIIPKSISGNELFKYIDSKQIDIMILNSFKIQNQMNDNFFKIEVGEK